MAVGMKGKLSTISDEHVEPTTTPDAQRLTKRITVSALTATAISQAEQSDDMTVQLTRISQSSRSPYEKRVWTALCQIPRGQFTTYGILSQHLGSSPRAVGNALRRNPFAPGVPCHRVVATGGKLGGFKGKWPRNGEGITLDEKRVLLRKEGIKFAADGKAVLGTPFAFGVSENAKCRA
jgi:methylated-DNA-[protein]-cysteine S-methyltransferase